MKKEASANRVNTERRSGARELQRVGFWLFRTLLELSHHVRSIVYGRGVICSLARVAGLERKTESLFLQAFNAKKIGTLGEGID